MILSVAGLATWPLAAWAQERPSRPYRGIFGTSGGAGSTQSLIATFSTLAGRDDISAQGAVAGAAAPTASAGDGTTPLSSGPTTFGAWAGAIAYSLDHSGVGISLGTSANSRFVPGRATSFPTSWSSSAGVRWKALKHTDVRASFESDRTPISALSLFPGLPAGAVNSALSSDFAIDAREIYRSNLADLQLTQALSGRTALVLSYDYQRSHFSNTDDQRTVQSGSAALTHRLTRNLTLRLGYSGALGDYVDSTGVPARFRNDSIDAGVDYSGSLALSRRTTASFRTGTAFISDRAVHRFSVVGDAALTRELGRSWDASLAYSRNANFVAALTQPAFIDSLTAALGGLLTRRLHFQAAAGLATGAAEFVEAADHGYAAYHGSVGVSTGLSRYFQLRLDYTYYRYSSKASELQFFGQQRLSDNSINVGVDVFAPLFVRAARREHAAR